MQVLADDCSLALCGNAHAASVTLSPPDPRTAMRHAP